MWTGRHATCLKDVVRTAKRSVLCAWFSLFSIVRLQSLESSLDCRCLAVFRFLQLWRRRRFGLQTAPRRPWRLFDAVADRHKTTFHQLSVSLCPRLKSKAELVAALLPSEWQGDKHNHTRDFTGRTRRRLMEPDNLYCKEQWHHCRL